MVIDPKRGESDLQLVRLGSHGGGHTRGCCMERGQAGTAAQGQDVTDIGAPPSSMWLRFPQKRG